MVIKIVKKRTTVPTAPKQEAAPVPDNTPGHKAATKPEAEREVAVSAEDYTQSFPNKVPPKPTKCSFCNQEYCYPCHGKSETCQNAVWVKQRKAEGKPIPTGEAH